MEILTVVVGALCVLALMYFALTGLVHVMLRGYSRPEELLSAAGPEEDKFFVKSGAEHAAWLSEHGFVWIGAYRCMGIFFGAWEHESEPTYFVLYVKGRILTSTEFGTTLNGGQGGLSTGDRNDALLMPCQPGSYHQAFTGRTLDERWQLHREALDYLCDRKGMRVGGNGDFKADFLADLSTKAHYVLSLPFSCLRWPYWFFVRRHRMCNKRVQAQIETGLAPEPPR